MIYKKFQDLQLSSLGMGCMRLPLLQDSKQIDIIAVKQMVKYAMDNGINYFDTAWGYHDGQSEKVMGEVLSDYPRETFYLASKFPGYDSTTLSRPQEIFEEQLKRCKTDYFDFYMFHNVCESNIDGYLDETTTSRQNPPSRFFYSRYLGHYEPFYGRLRRRNGILSNST